MQRILHSLCSGVIAVSLLGLSACSARLQVAVHVYDGERPITQVEAVAFANQVLTRGDLIKNAVIASEQVLDVAQQANLIDPAKKDAARDAIATRIKDSAAKDNAEPSAVDLAKQFLKDCTAKKTRLDEPCRETYTNLRAAVRIEEVRASFAESHVASGLKQSLKDPSNASNATKADEIVRETFSRMGSGIAAGGTVDGRAVGTPLFDPMVGTLVRGSRPLRGKIGTWRPLHRHEWIPFSRASFVAHGGNSQFVVVREGLLVFRQKSLDFDPTPVVGAGVATSKLGLKVASALMSSSGIQLPNSGANTSPGSDGTGSAEDDAIAARTLLAAQKTRTRAFVGRLANLYARLENPASVDELNAVHEELKREVQLFEAQLVGEMANEP